MRILCAALLLAGCVDTTGGAIISFQAAAAGPADATGGALESDTSAGYHLSVTTAKLHIGALYLRIVRPQSGTAAQPCIAAGNAYSGQVREGLDVDLLRADPQPFPEAGEGTATNSPIGEIWLTGGPVEATNDGTTIVELAGVATKDAASFPFSAEITISTGNRGVSSTNPGLPSANPICKQRIVTPIPANFTPSDGGTVLVRADPRIWLNNIDFAEVPEDTDQPGTFTFKDDNTGQGGNLFNTILAASIYSMTFTPGPTP